MGVKGSSPERDASPSRPARPHLQDVISVRVTQVPRADLRAHVPAAERGRRELQAPDLQQHVTHRREGVPAQAQGRKPLQPEGFRGGSGCLRGLAGLATPRPPVLHLTQSPSCSRGVLQGHLEDQLGGQSKELWGLIRGLEQEWQHVKAAVSWGPAMLDAELQGAGPEAGLRALPPALLRDPLHWHLPPSSLGTPSLLHWLLSGWSPAPLPEPSLAGLPLLRVSVPTSVISTLAGSPRTEPSCCL